MAWLVHTDRIEIIQQGLDMMRSLIRDYFRDRRGAIAIVFALSAIPMMGAMGAGIDFARAKAASVELQSTLDGAVLAGAAVQTGQNAVATNYFNSNLVLDGATLTNVAFTPNNDGTYSGTATITIPTTFLGVMGMDTIQVTDNARAAVAVAPGKGAICMITLNTTAAKSIDDSGSTKMNAADCFLQVNSNASNAVSLTGSAAINTAENCIVGGIAANGSATVNPGKDAVCQPMADPFAGWTKPTVGACDHTNFTVNTTSTLQPGVYCGGLKISSAPNVTFAPGLYIIKDGVLSSSGTSTMTGNGVSFFLTGTGAAVSTSGGSAWHLVAMSTGALKGFVFFADEGSGIATGSTLTGTSELYFEGVVYPPKQRLTLSGGSSAFTLSAFTSYIADTVTLSGSAALNVLTDPTKTSVPIPSALLAAKGSFLRLVS